MPRILVVSATRHDKLQFEKFTYLGLALKRLGHDKSIESAIAFQNNLGLPTVFNAQITEANRDKVVLFIHDDAYIDDYYLTLRLEEALRSFDVVGVAGNKSRSHGQASWAFTVDYPAPIWDRKENLAGGICHFLDTGLVYDLFGLSAAPAECQLLDGVFLAAKVSQLLDHNVRFDEQFPFHFYDMDFCRTARAAGLKLGTWPIAISHASAGIFGSPEWHRYKFIYFQKWPE